MTNVNTIEATGFEHLHVNDMGEGCVVLWQTAASGKRESLVVDVAQLEMALDLLRTPNRSSQFASHGTQD